MLINLDERIKEYIESEIREKLKVKVNVSECEGYSREDKSVHVNVQLIFNDKVISETNDYHVL